MTNTEPQASVPGHIVREVAAAESLLRHVDLVQSYLAEASMHMLAPAEGIDATAAYFGPLDRLVTLDVISWSTAEAEIKVFRNRPTEEYPADDNYEELWSVTVVAVPRAVIASLIEAAVRFALAE